MSENPFTGMAEPHHDRWRREEQLRRQRRAAFWVALGATALVALAAGVGGAVGGWAATGEPGNTLTTILGGLAGGTVGGVAFFVSALWRITREVVANEVFGGGDEIDIGATLFWSAVGGAALGGFVGALWSSGRDTEFRPGVGWGAAIGAAAALAFAIALRRRVRRTSRTGPGPVRDRPRG